VDQIKQWWIEERAKKAVEKLVAHEFDAVYAKTKEEAVQELWKHITPKQKIGIGGSLTVRGLGILEKLEAQDYTIYDHWKPGLSRENILEIRKLQMACDLFLSSANAITLNGELVNIDGIGNRVNSINFGPGKVILVAGYNKLLKMSKKGSRG
jgi:hypothetical protein